MLRTKIIYIFCRDRRDRDRDRKRSRSKDRKRFVYIYILENAFLGYALLALLEISFGV